MNKKDTKPLAMDVKETIAAAQTSLAKESRVVEETTSVPRISSGNNPLQSHKLYVPYTNARSQYESWKNSRPAEAALIKQISDQPQSFWFGDWHSDVYSAVDKEVSKAHAEGAMPVLVAYNIPGRDCGSYSAGGANGAEKYRSWIRAFARGISSRKAAVILEPDALASMDCLSQVDQATRMSLLSDAVSTLRANPNTIVYIDAGHASWMSTDKMITRLKAAGIDKANGFSLNVSNYYKTSDNTVYGEIISRGLGGAHFVIDTSRNGNGPKGSEWCNPGGRALGQSPTTNTGNVLIDAYLWIKAPGESDGPCNGGPNAGEWWSDYALGLIRNK